MNGDPEDVLRSLRRYVSQMLGSPPWKVRVQRERVDDDQRPVAVVDWSGPLVTLQARAGTTAQGDVHKQATFTVTAYPQLGDNAAQSGQIAGELAALLDAGFSRGLVTDATPPVNIGAPWRFPLYDFAGVPVAGAGRAGPDDPYAYARIDQTFAVRPIQDAMDELRYSVVATVRADWWQGGRTRPPAPLAVGGIPGTFVPGSP